MFTIRRGGGGGGRVNKRVTFHFIHISSIYEDRAIQSLELVLVKSTMSVASVLE